MTIEKIRVSIGSATILGFTSIKLESPPTTIYVMTYKKGKCIANCGFCPQARNSNSLNEKLSRINWPIFPFKDFLTKLKYTASLKKFQRICIQTLNYAENFQDLIEIISEIRKVTNIPISVAIPPISKDELKDLKLCGVQRVGIALDGATQEIFEKIKGIGVNGPYFWRSHFDSLRDALEVFGNGLVSTHIIIGFGETQKDTLKLIAELHELSILPGLFAFTPIEGTKFENMIQPNINHFRKIQLGRYLLINNYKKLDDFTFNQKGDIIYFNLNKKELRNFVEESEAFRTTGCPGCNRPYYTSKPSGPIYNYPRKLNENEKEEIYKLLERFVN